MKQPDFSVIIVTYKRLEELKLAIDSVLKQSLTNYECLVFNDFPADNPKVEELLQRIHNPRFQFFPSEKSCGANHWRNQGVRFAQGRFIAFLDDDDTWFPNKLEEHLKVHDEQQAFLVYSDYYKSWPSSDRPDLFKSNAILKGDIFTAISSGAFSISTTSSVTIKNDISWELFDENLTSFQDWDAWFNLTQTKPDGLFFRIEKPLLYFIQHDNSRVSKNHEKRIAALNQLLEKYKSKGINISGFFVKEKLNLLLLSFENESPMQKMLKLGYSLLKNPSFFNYKYTYKRVGRFLFKEGKT
ncbi:glycosyltransferase family 2 protein [Algoriphagus sp. AGSA1]|uniref:glycosyltransferase family 2 protein n=1 Tax=Algoriphagus sp. AGSA1 TaxID=2907213 RepID=UPI001F3E5FE4|nr:glycosyltransferase family 2 protein [Algoriphagus sp. AGSA1]MCE7055298.1 glycosyltransferase family 2 protein [Algoriphagus sp. AGSA1]